MMNDKFYMKLALTNARAMKGQTDPNPLVGAVIVNDNRIVGIGAHMKAGEPHAEIHAIRMAGEHAKGGTIYVTLEPCSHHGRTGPCAVAIVEAGIKKVVIAALDPNPIVSGNGIKILKDAGIEVITGVCEEESRQMNEVFNKFIVKKQPFVTLKAGMTMDGKIATYTNSSMWMISEEVRQDVHQLRSENMAILVGVNTVMQDHPELTMGISNGRNPIRVILDSSLRIPLVSKAVTDQKAETWIFTSQNYDQEKRRILEASGISVFATSGSGQADLQDVMQILGEKLVSSLLIEGDGTINAALLEKQIIDKIVLYMDPKLAGGPTFQEGSGIKTLSDAVELRNGTVTPIGKNFKFTGFPVYKL